MLEYSLLNELVKDVVEKQQLLDEHLLAMHTIIPNTVREVLPLLDGLLSLEYGEEGSVAKFELWCCCFGEVVVVSIPQVKESSCIVVPSVPFCSCKQFCSSLYGSAGTCGDFVCKHIILALFATQRRLCKIHHMSFEEWTSQVSKLLTQD